MAFYRPFVFAIGVEIMALVLLVAYRAIAPRMITGAEVACFLVICFLAVYSVLNVLAVARTVVMHALLRAEMLK